MNRQNRSPLAQETILTPPVVQTPVPHGTQTTHTRLAHRRRTAIRAARRQAVLAHLRAYDTLGAGMKAAGVTWATVKGMMRAADFRAEVRAIRTIQRARRQHRHRPENQAHVRALVAAGVSREVACAEVRWLHGDRRGKKGAVPGGGEKAGVQGNAGAAR